MVEDKRRFSRIFFQMAAELTVPGALYRVERIANLSVGGCLFEIAEDIPVGTECSVLVILNPADRRMNVEVAGEVVRSGKQTVSVKFTAIDPESLNHLQNIIRYNAPDPDQIEGEIKDHPGIV